MGETPDVHYYDSRLKGELDRVRSADIDEASREVILEFVRWEDTNRDISTATIANHAKNLRLLADRTGLELTDFTKEELDEALFSLKHDHELGDGTLRNYRKSTRIFLEWRGVEWYRDVRVGAAITREIDARDILTEEEVDAVLDACDNPRDKAVVALMADAGLRIGAVLSLRIGDFQLDADPPVVGINAEGHVKGASGTVPITWSKRYIINWLDVHPRDDPTAPFVHRLREPRHAEGDEEGNGFVRYDPYRRRIKQLGKKAGLDRPISPHTFRKTAISQWIRDGLTEQEIKHRAHWDKDSTQFAQYSGVTDEELNEQIAARYGLLEEEDRETHVTQCPDCGEAVRSTASFCSGCARPLTQAALAIEERRKRDKDRSLALLDPETAAAFLDAYELVDTDPALKVALEEVAEETD